jgi:hypothetical protein
MVGGAPRFHHGKYAMEEVLVARTCLAPAIIRELMTGGVEALRTGQITTDWRPLATAPGALDTWAVIPDGSTITLTIESGDPTGSVVYSRTMELKTGAQSISLADFPAGTQVRLRARLMENKWGAVPIIQTAILNAAGESLRWSTTKEWRAGSSAAALKIGL